jgi:hypothetical protein
LPEEKTKHKLLVQVNQYKHIEQKCQFYMSIVSSIVKHLVKSTLGSEMPCFRAAQIAAPNQSQEFQRKKVFFSIHIPMAAEDVS